MESNTTMSQREDISVLNATLNNAMSNPWWKMNLSRSRFCNDPGMAEF